MVPNSPTWTMGKYVCRVALRNYRQKGRNSQEMRLRRTVPRPLKRKKLPGEALVTSFKTFAFRLILRTCFVNFSIVPCEPYRQKGRSSEEMRLRRTAPRPLERKKLPGEALVTSFKTFAFRLVLRICFVNFSIITCDPPARKEEAPRRCA